MLGIHLTSSCRLDDNSGKTPSPSDRWLTNRSTDMLKENSVYQRRRAPTESELQMIPWLSLLQAQERAEIVPQLVVSDPQVGDYVCRVGRPVTFWFGEGTALKREFYRYNIQPLRPSVVAGLPLETFHWLIDHSLGFNRFIMQQLNERLGQFIAARELDRMNNPELRLARHLATLFNPVLFSGVGEVLRITQQELAYLVGLSRQRVNEALRVLEARQLIRVEYGGLRILDLQGLRTAQF